MIRLDRRDFDEPAQLARLAETAKMTPEAFRARFGYLVR
jgi:6-phosphofructokinase 1